MELSHAASGEEAMELAHRSLTISYVLGLATAATSAGALEGPGETDFASSVLGDLDIVATDKVGDSSGA